MQTRVRVDEWETALARSALYELLSRCLAYPSPSHREALRATVVPLVESISTGDPSVDDAIAAVLDGLAAPLDELRAAHTQVFTHIEPEDCPPYESAYGFAEIFRQTEVMADVAGFYRAHGLRVGGSERERPDNVVTELEFMSFMARKEAVALDQLGPEEIDECRRTQARFLQDHLGCWAVDFGRRLALVCEHPLLRATGTLLATWLEAELCALGVEPTARRSEPVPRPMPDDGACGGACEGLDVGDASPALAVELTTREGPGGAR